MLISSSTYLCDLNSPQRETGDENHNAFSRWRERSLSKPLSIIRYFARKYYSIEYMKDEVSAVLLKEVSDGSHAAFERLYKHYFRKCFSIALYFVHSPSLAEDVVSEVFLNLWNKRTNLKNIRNWESFLFIFVRNNAITFAGKHGRIGHDSLEMMTVSFQSSDLSPEDMALRQEFEDIMRSAVERLPDKSRMVYYMVREENMSHKEVGKALGISERTVNSHMTAAVKKLVSSLSDYLKPPIGNKS